MATLNTWIAESDGSSVPRGFYWFYTHADLNPNNPVAHGPFPNEGSAIQSRNQFLQKLNVQEKSGSQLIIPPGALTRSVKHD